MKKKLVCIVVLCCTMLPVMAAEGKIYRDYINGYSGYAIAEFFPSKNGIVTDRDGVSRSLSEFCDFCETEIKSKGTFLGKKEKITKEENFLIWSALNEYELLDEEVYVVIITTDQVLGDGVEFSCFLVTIKNNGRNCTPYGSWVINIKQ